MARSHSDLSIIEAVETLSNIADLEFDGGVGIIHKHEINVDNERVNYKTVHWLHQQDANTTISLVRETFKVILYYLYQFYKKEYHSIADQKTLDEIRTIMVLVGEAAKKLDKYTSLFHQAHKSITESREYKQLEEFYFSKIARKADEGILGKWVLSLAINEPSKPLPIKLAKSQQAVDVAAQHVFVDLETVKKDTEYELFFIRKENGSHFFSTRLLRNIKLVCDVRNYFGPSPGEDPLTHLEQWLDRVAYLNARQILKTLGSKVNHFYHDLHQAKNPELIDLLNKTLIALRMSSHSQNLLRHNPVKSCSAYFADFQLFLRQILQARSYQKWMLYPPKESNHLALDLLDIIYTICKALYIDLNGLFEMVPTIHNLIEESSKHIPKGQEEAQRSQSLSARLANDHAAMSKIIQRHPNGPLLKLLSMLDEKTFHIFDPLMQGNIPNELFDLYTSEQRIAHVRFAAPICQEFIQIAPINEEFKAFLSYYKSEAVRKKHLLINLGDRTSWRDHARCIALEKLQDDSIAGDALSVVTLSTNTDFFNQLAPYHEIHQAHLFKEQFKEHLTQEGFGFFFPPAFDKEQLIHFMDGALEAIHHIFFSRKNVLSREERLEFIEIFYFTLQLKLIEWVKPDSFSLIGKDGIDIGATYSAGLFAFLTLMQNEEWSDNAIDHLNFMLYAPALTIRERVILPERFNRMLNALKTIESVRQEFGPAQFIKIIQEAFALLFDTPILNAKLLIPASH